MIKGYSIMKTMPNVRDNGWTLWKIIAIFITPVVLLVLLVGKWAYHSDGHITLWHVCWKLNGTEEDDCNGSVAQGPVFLDLTRTMLSIAVAVYAFMHMCAYNMGPITPPIMTFQGQAKARASQICYFLSGLLILSATVIYDINFYGYYSKNKEMKDLNRALCIYIGYICGSIIWAVNIPIATNTDTGFKVYIKKKLNFMKRTSRVASVNGGNGNEPQDVAVKTRCAKLACLCKRSREREDNNCTEQRNGTTHTELSSTESGRNSVRHEGRHGEVAPDADLCSNRTANSHTRRSITPPPSYDTGDYYANYGNGGTGRIMAPPPYSTGHSSSHYTNTADNSRTRRIMIPPSSNNTDLSSGCFTDNANDYTIITPPPLYNTDQSSSRYENDAGDRNDIMTPPPLYNSDIFSTHFADNENNRVIMTPPPSYEEVIRNNP